MVFVISLKNLLGLRIVSRDIVLDLSVERVGIRDVGKKGEQSSEVRVGGNRGGIKRWTSRGAGQGNATLLSHCDGHTGRKQCTCSRRGQLCCPPPCRCYALGSPSFANTTLIPLEEALHVVSLPTAQIGLACACIVLLLHAHMRADVHPPGPEIERLIVVYLGCGIGPLRRYVSRCRSKLEKQSPIERGMVGTRRGTDDHGEACIPLYCQWYIGDEARPASVE